MNETLKVIADRFSCRAFTTDALAEGDVTAIAQAANQSPSAMNNQPWEIIVLQNKALMDELE